MNTLPNLVQVQGQRAHTTSLIVAEGCSIQHKNLMALIRKYAEEFSELGLVAFETRPRLPGQHGGGDIEYAILNEDQATFAITLFRNTPVVLRFKLALVKAFRRAIDQINRDFSNPPRPDVLTNKRKAGRSLTDALVEARQEAGKTTATVHFMSEAKLCNWVVTGQFAGLDEQSLSNEQLLLLTKVRDREAALLVAGLDYPSRKAHLVDYARRLKPQLLAA